MFDPSIHCLAVGEPCSEMALKRYRGLGRRDLADLMGGMMEECNAALPQPKTLYPNVWAYYDRSMQAGFALNSLGRLAYSLEELRTFLDAIQWASVPPRLRYQMELVVALPCADDRRRRDVLQTMRQTDLIQTVLPKTTLCFLGYDYIELNSVWSALAYIADWRGPSEALNEHGLCHTRESMRSMLELYLSADDPQRLPPAEYRVYALASSNWPVELSA